MCGHGRHSRSKHYPGMSHLEGIAYRDRRRSDTRLANHLPGPVHMTPVVARFPIATRSVKRAVQHRARNEDFARGIDAFQNGAILVVACPCSGSRPPRTAPARRARSAGRHRPRTRTRCARRTCSRMTFGQAFAPEGAQHEPQLQRAEAAAQRHAVIHQVDGARIRRRSADIRESAKRRGAGPRDGGYRRRCNPSASSATCADWSRSESARSQPSNAQRNSGTSAAEPA